MLDKLNINIINLITMNHKIKQIVKIVFYPLVVVRRFILKYYMRYLQNHDLKKLAGLIYKQNFKRRLNWENPQNLSEKINWMKFYSDTTLWTECADKYRVRKYVESKGLGNILVKLYGVWENAYDIDFNSLPNSFVLKTNHACGTVLLVKDKNKLDIQQTKNKLNEWLQITIGKATAEPHYLGIKPCIIAEEYLNVDSDESIVDYKLFCVNGETELVMVCSERKIGCGASISLYDKDWIYSPERLGECHANDNVPKIPKLKSFEQMKDYARILCKDFPFVRMDFYDIDGKIYFGEMTFTPKGGYCSTLTMKEQIRIGEKIILPKKLERKD